MFTKSSWRQKGGFTLIELLVVISIIGLLSSVVLASLNTARAKGRDAKRLSELHSISVALELYYDKYGFYPDWNTSAWGADCSGFRGDNTPNTFLKPLVDEGFLGTYIDDSTSGDCKIQYRSEKPSDGSSGAQGWRIVVHLETKPNTNLACYNDAYWYCVSVNYP